MKWRKFTLSRVRHPALLLPKMAFFRPFSANRFSLVWVCVLLGKNEEYPDKPYGTKVRFGSSGTLVSRRGSLGPEVTGEHFKLDACRLIVSIEITKLSMSYASCNTVSRPPQSIFCFSLDF